LLCNDGGAPGGGDIPPALPREIKFLGRLANRPAEPLA
jgi:hypothetical protein